MTTRAATNLILILSLSGLAARAVTAQFPMTEGASVDRDRTYKTEDTNYELEARISAMRYLIDHAGKDAAVKKKDPQLALKELQDDFTHLQLTNKDLVLKSARSKDIDLRFTERSAADINKRAERLLTNLSLPAPDNAGFRPVPSDITDEKQLRASITQLGWLIYNFTKNPIFKEAQVLDTTAARKARADLDSILELSVHIKKSSEQLAKGKNE